VNHKIFGENTPEFTLSQVETAFLGCYRWPVNIVPHPTNNAYLLRIMEAAIIKNESMSIEETITGMARHHEKLEELGLSVPKYDITARENTALGVPAVLMAVERVDRVVVSPEEEYAAKMRLKRTLTDYFEWVDSAGEKAVLYDIASPHQSMLGRIANASEVSPAVHLIDVDPRMRLINRDEQGLDRELATARTMIEDARVWQRSFAPEDFNADGQFAWH
jgi:hypothetical protein